MNNVKGNYTTLERIKLGHTIDIEDVVDEYEERVTTLEAELKDLNKDYDRLEEREYNAHTLLEQIDTIINNPSITTCKEIKKALLLAFENSYFEL